MKIINTLYHPNEKYWKSCFLQFTWLWFYGLMLVFQILNFSEMVTNPFFTGMPFSPIACASIVFGFNFLLSSLFVVIVQNHSVDNSRTGFITFLFAISLLSLIFNSIVYSLYFTQKLHPFLKLAIEKNLTLNFASEFIVRPIWLFLCWRVRRNNQLNQIRISIESSPEAMRLLENLEVPDSKENIQQVINYLLFRIPHSQQNLIKPLFDEASRRLATSK